MDTKPVAYVQDVVADRWPFADEAIEIGAAALAEALHGGKWATHYTEAQKDVWRGRARVALRGA